MIRTHINENEARGTRDTHERRRKACSLLVEKSEINRPLEVVLVDGNRILKRILRLRWKGVERICLVKETEKWRAVVNMIISFDLHKMRREFLD